MVQLKREAESDSFLWHYCKYINLNLIKKLLNLRFFLKSYFLKDVMKKIIRFLVLLVVIVVSFYLMMAFFVIFAFLAALGGLVWLYFRYFGKSGKPSYSTNGVTIDQVSQSVHTSASTFQETSSQESESNDATNKMQKNSIYSEADVTSVDYDVWALYEFYEKEVRTFCLSPSPSVPVIVPDIIELTNHVEANDQLRAKTYRLLGELYEANNDHALALKYYQTALSLDVKVGVKRKITMLQKMINN